ncbi:hypothetical protein SGLAM104S_02625 [Streptomyces glaucescens]
MPGAVVDDVLGEHRTDAGQGVELLHRGRAEGDGSHRCRARNTSGSARSRELSGSGPADDHLLPVHEEPRPVEPVEVRARPHPARRLQRVHHPRSRGKPVDPGFPHLPADVHHDLGARCARRRGGPGPGRGTRCFRVRRRLDVRSRLDHLRRPYGLGPPAPEVLHGESGGHHEQDGQRQHAPPFQSDPGLQPHRHPLPQGKPRPAPPGRPRLSGLRRLPLLPLPTRLLLGPVRRCAALVRHRWSSPRLPEQQPCASPQFVGGRVPLPGRPAAQRRTAGKGAAVRGGTPAGAAGGGRDA